MRAQMARRGGIEVFEGRPKRLARVNELLREVIAEELERLADSDEDLGLVTVTAVEVTADLQHADVYFASLTDAQMEALSRQRRRLQAKLAGEVRLRHTPTLRFARDPAMEAARRVEAAIARIRRRQA